LEHGRMVREHRAPARRSLGRVRFGPGTGSVNPASPPRRGAPDMAGEAPKGSRRCRGARAPAPRPRRSGMTLPARPVPGKPHPRERRRHGPAIVLEGNE
jgi:hypothetical protein